jgi:hypothetical protein
MPFQISIPKQAQQQAQQQQSQHRKVTVESFGEYGVCLNLKELLLASGAEPKDVLPAFGFDSFQVLMRLSGVWDVVQEMHASNPATFSDSQEPVIRLCHSLLAKNMHPAELCRETDARVIAHLLELQVNWDDIKVNYRAPEPACDFCGVVGPVLRCSGCMAIRKVVLYCNRECQQAGWKRHKKDGCGLFASEAAKKRVADAVAVKTKK